ncbi:MAG: type 1 glutamine amidotransferase [Thermodesulfobacteriota bacterium]
MKIHYLQHVPFEGVARIAHWAAANDCPLAGTALYRNEPLPDLSAFDCLVVMGGPMGVADEEVYSWLKPEKRFIERVIAEGKKVVGICLGAQLIAEVMGARVSRNKTKEIGWYPVTLTETGRQSAMGDILPATFQAFHWHGDTFEIPRGAIHLARSRACDHQGFLYQEQVLGLQFHLESTPESIEQLLENCNEEIAPAPYIQDAETIRGGYHLIGQTNACMENILSFFNRR